MPSTTPPLRVETPVRLDFAGGWTDVPAFAETEGGAVLNAAISPGVRGLLESSATGLRLSYETAVPPGAGLGASASMNVAWLSLVTGAIGRPLSGAALAEAAFHLGATLGITGGRQDEYAAALGGVNFLRFDREGVTVEPLAIAPTVLEQMRARLVLCYSGERRLSGAIHDAVWGGFARGEPAVSRALRRLRDLALAARDAILDGDLETLAAIIGENWTCQQALHPSVTNDRLERLFRVALANGAISGKACGAGGGGCIVFCCPAPEAAAEAASALDAAGGIILDFDFAPRLTPG